MSRLSVIDGVGFAGAVVACSLLAVPVVAQTRDAAETVVAAAAELADTIETRHAEFESNPVALYALVDELLLPYFDMRRGGRAILAQHWESMNEAERARFIDGVYNYLVATYGTLLVYFEHDTLRVLPFDAGAGTSPVRVKTVLTMNDGTEVDVDFVMVNTADQWRVVDVVAEGVSYVKTYRSQFGVDIAIDGLPSVLDWLELKAAPRFASSSP